MLKKIIIEEDGKHREYEDILCVSFWTKEDIIDICEDRNIDLENESDKFWNYLSSWMDGCDYYPAAFDEIYDCVYEVLKRRNEWDI